MEAARLAARPSSRCPAGDVQRNGIRLDLVPISLAAPLLPSTNWCVRR